MIATRRTACPGTEVVIAWGYLAGGIAYILTCVLWYYEFHHHGGDHLLDQNDESKQSLRRGVLVMRTLSALAMIIVMTSVVNYLCKKQPEEVCRRCSFLLLCAGLWIIFQEFLWFVSCDKWTVLSIIVSCSSLAISVVFIVLKIVQLAQKVRSLEQGLLGRTAEADSEQHFVGSSGGPRARGALESGSTEDSMTQGDVDKDGDQSEETFDLQMDNILEKNDENNGDRDDNKAHDPGNISQNLTRRKAAEQLDFV